MTEDIREDEVIEKEVTQFEKVEPVVRSLSDMRYFYKHITEKLVGDKICFLCKKEIGAEDPFDIVVVPNEKLEKGMAAFVCACKVCNTEE